MVAKLKELALRKVGRNYMLVEVADNEVNMTNVYSMNSTAAWLWESLDTPYGSIMELVDRMCSQYDVDREIAIADIEAQLRQWKDLGLIE